VAGSAVTAPREVLDAHTTLYERLKYPPQLLTDFYAQFFSDKALRGLENSDYLAAWLQMFVPARNERDFLDMVCRPLYSAPTFQVAADIVGAVTATYEATISRAARLSASDLPSESGFAWLDAPVVLRDAGGFSIATRALSWAPQYVTEDFMDGQWPPEAPGNPVSRHGVRLSSYAHVDDADSTTVPEMADRIRATGMSLSLSHSAFVPFNIALPTREPGGNVTADDIFRWAQTLWMFMGTEIVSTAKTQGDRPARRRAQKSRVYSDVNVVTLRRIRLDGAEVSHRDIDWSCRWVVQAHERHLDSPGSDEKPHHARVDGAGQVCLVCGRRTTHIRAYVKGPDGAPLKAVPETVYRVAR
jgi:hypothetical protein